MHNGSACTYNSPKQEQHEEYSSECRVQVDVSIANSRKGDHDEVGGVQECQIDSVLEVVEWVSRVFQLQVRLDIDEQDR